MTYEPALAKAWQDLENASKERSYSLSFLSDTYSIDLNEKRVLSLSCNVPAKTHLAILLLHYLRKKIEGLPPLTGEWISFKELQGGEIYYSAFKKRVIDTLLRKTKDTPEVLTALKKRFTTGDDKVADVNVVIEVCEAVSFLLTYWKGDDEFGPEVNVLFDKNIKDIFCTEDVVVLSDVVVHSI